MEPTPRPPTNLTFPDLIRRTFQIYRANFATIIGLVAFVTIPVSLLNIIIAPQPATLLAAPTISDTPDMAPLLISILGFVQTILITAPLTYLVSEYLFNRKLTIGEAFSGVSNRFTQIGCGVLLIGFFIGLMAIFIMMLLIAFPPALIVSGVFLHIIITTSALMFPVLTLESITASSAFSRSWSLGKRRFWATFGVGVVTALISLLIGSVLGTVISQILDSVAPNMNINLQYLLLSIISDVISIFLIPISPIAFTLIYYDIRYSTEDLGTLLNTSVTSSQRPNNFPSPVSGFRFDSHDWRNIVILSVLGLLIGIAANSLIQQFIQQLAPGLR